MSYRSITMQYNHDKSRRISVQLDVSVIKKLRVLQSELMKKGNRNVTISEVLGLILREKLKT